MPPKSHSEISGKTKDLSKCQHSSLLVYSLYFCAFSSIQICAFMREFVWNMSFSKLNTELRCHSVGYSMLRFFSDLTSFPYSVSASLTSMFILMSFFSSHSPLISLPFICVQSLPSGAGGSSHLMATGWCSKQAKVSLPSWMFRGSPSDLTTTSSACLADKQNLK